MRETFKKTKTDALNGKKGRNKESDAQRKRHIRADLH